MRKKIAIIGAGISGMATAYLLDKRFEISIFAKAFSPNITSDRAAAFWFPYHIRNDKRGIHWCRVSYKYYQQFTKNSQTGVSMQTLKKVVRKDAAAETVWIDFMPEASYSVMNSRELTDVYVTCYTMSVPLIETQIFLPWLKVRLEKMGVQFYQKEIFNIDELQDDFDWVINCSGLGSKRLCGDKSIIPVKGQVGLLSPKKGMDIFLDNEKPLYIVPRKDAIIVGGTYEEEIYTETTEPETIKRLLDNAYEVFPELRRQKVLGSWAGLRPYREEVRVEKETGRNIIHNYGHGGSGFTLAFGCAEEVLKLLNNV